ncbi:MAG: DUF736 domain-containing protein [Sphingomonadales bacterium]|nr:DUF736 domain-containing protein [Sphingomonadales bacterium]NCQ22651.1 DUF736 domain-containing protein [Sphingomonadales bacterium]NCT04877.1 DUF736 domain-containing protein [Sphingomonadales bacterium]
MRIGTFVAADGGFSGRLHSLTLDIALILEPIPASDSDKAPDYRVMAGDDNKTREVGAAWKHVGEKAGAFVTLLLDDPAFVQPLRANLFQGDGNEHVLVWSRPSRRETAG